MAVRTQGGGAWPQEAAGGRPKVPCVARPHAAGGTLQEGLEASPGLVTRRLRAPLACSPCVLTWREILGADGILAESRLGVERSLARLECRVHLLHVLLVGAVWRAALLIEIGEDPALSGIDQLDLGGRG